MSTRNDPAQTAGSFNTRSTVLFYTRSTVLVCIKVKMDISNMLNSCGIDWCAAPAASARKRKKNGRPFVHNGKGAHGFATHAADTQHGPALTAQLKNP